MSNEIFWKKKWIRPVLTDLDTEIIKQEINQQENELLLIMASDENAFRLLTGSIGQ